MSLDLTPLKKPLPAAKNNQGEESFENMLFGSTDTNYQALNEAAAAILESSCSSCSEEDDLGTLLDSTSSSASSDTSDEDLSEFLFGVLNDP